MATLMKCGFASLAAPTATREARRIGEEVETLYTNGPAAGGGAWKSARQVVAVASALIPDSVVRTAVTMVEA